MAGFALPIKEDYVAHWSVWECVREFIQNAVDEEYQRGNEMEVKYKPQTNALIITNHGADMGREALLLGETSKRGDSGARGQFGEGLDLALLVGVRSGLEIMVETQTERWTPVIEARQEYQGRRCLVIQTRKLQKRRNGVRVRIMLGDGMWPQIKKRFLFLQKPKPSEVIDTPTGKLLAGAEYKGMLFVRGIYVCTKDGMQFGYDFSDMQLDRDRRMISDWQVEWKAAEILQVAAEKSRAKGGEKIQETVWSMLDDGNMESKELPQKVVNKKELLASFVETFRLKHGDDAIPVRSMAESQQLDHYGERGVVVSQQLYDVLSAHFGTFEKRMKDRRFTPIKTYSWGDLAEDEQEILKRATAIVDNAITARFGLSSSEHTAMANLEVVDWADDRLYGTCNLVTGHMRIARHRLGKGLGCVVRTLVHEMAHAVTEASDGTKNHVSMIEEIWQAAFEEALTCSLD